MAAVNHVGLFVWVLVGMVLLGWTTASDTAEPKTELLWPRGAPGAMGAQHKDKPTIAIWLPETEKANGAAVLVFPGGGYDFVAMDHEGKQIAQWLTANGIAAFVVEYRHRSGGYGHPAPLQDAQRAISMVRSRAKELRINPDQIGVIGFSAGGHLASTTGTHFKRRAYAPKDKIDQVSCRPDFMILMYPVISLTQPFTNQGSKQNLLGDEPDKKLVRSLSSELQVTAETPPTFLVSSYEDETVPVENSVAFYLALRKAKVPCEMHVYQKGPHGVGLGKGHGPIASWPKLCLDWMRLLGMKVADKG